MTTTTATQTHIVREYTTAAGVVALLATDGTCYWLADLNERRISDFCANRAQVTIQAHRAFGRLLPAPAVGSVAWGYGSYPFGPHNR